MDPETAGVPSDDMRTAEAGKVALMSSAPTIAPSSCASTYLPSVRESICLPSHKPIDSLTLGKYVLAQLRSEEHTSELQSRSDLVCRLLLEKKKIKKT